MIQAPQMQYVPQQIQQSGYPQQETYSPVQYTNAQNSNTIYNYPTTSSYLPQQPQAKPQYNGVNLEILNPQGQGIPGNANTALQTAQPLSHAQYNGVNIEILNPQGQGSYLPNTNFIPAQFYPVQQAPLNIPPYQVSQIPQAITPFVPQQNNISQPLPPFIPQQNIPPVVQTFPPIVQQQNVPQQDVSPQNIPEQNVPEPVIQNQQNNTPPIIDTPVQQISEVNPEAFAGRLNTNDLDAQKTTIEEIAEKVKNSDFDGPALLDTQIFDSLVNIINKDTSSLQGPTQDVITLRQKNPEELTLEEQQLAGPTPLEKAAANKQISLYTIAYMQERLNNELEKRNGSALDLKDLPCIDTIVDTAKSNPDVELRKSAITCLSYIARPEYAQDLNTIFELAKNDEDDVVVETATNAIDNLRYKFEQNNTANNSSNSEAHAA